MTRATTFAVLLRAINVGGHNKISMAELRDLLSELGLDNVSTYIQSGNVVCSSTMRAEELGGAIKAAIAKRFGHDISVLVRTASDIDTIVDDFPYPSANPKASGVVFLAADVPGELDASAFAPDQCHVAGANVYMACANTFSDSKLTPAWIEKQTGLAGTRRNWATVLKLQAMVSE